MDKGTNKVVLITGGNRGIGLECCAQLARRGWTVVLASRDKALGEKAAASLAKENVTVHPLKLDVTRPAEIAKARAWIEKKFGRLDGVINNAAVLFGEDNGGYLHELKSGLFETTIQTNLIACYNLIREFIPMMKKQRFGRVVNVSSGYGSAASLTAKVGAYKLSKYALNGLTKILADEVNPKYIKINAVCPGWVRTRMGGPDATRDVQDGAKSVVWGVLLNDDGPSGGFFRDGKPAAW